jgi:hypothetical protein
MGRGHKRQDKEPNRLSCQEFKPLATMTALEGRLKVAGKFIPRRAVSPYGAVWKLTCCGHGVDVRNKEKGKGGAARRRKYVGVLAKRKCNAAEGDNFCRQFLHSLSFLQGVQGQAPFASVIKATVNGARDSWHSYDICVFIEERTSCADRRSRRTVGGQHQEAGLRLWQVRAPLIEIAVHQLDDLSS